MTDSELIRQVSKDLGLGKPMVEATIRCFIEKVIDNALNGETVTIKGFAKVEPYTKPAHEQRNPSNDKVEMFPDVRKVKIKVSKRFRDAMREYGVEKYE